MTRIVALDLSLTSTGICVPDGTTLTLRPKTEREVDLAARLNWLGTRLWQQLDWENPQLAIIEGYSLHSPGPLGALRRAEWVGCVRRDLRRMRVPIVEVPPAQLKSWATGNGNATKEAMTAAAQAAGGNPQNDDEADAYLLWALAELTVNDRDHFGDPKERIRRLAVADALVWPDPKDLAC